MKKVKLGDVFMIDVKIGKAYFQCIKEASATECETIRILPGVFEYGSNVDLEKFVNEKETFFIQFPLKYAFKKLCVEKIGNFVVPERVELPKYYRSKHIINGEFICWHIIDVETLVRRSVKNLSDEEKKLSSSGIWNDTLLVEKIAEGWSPETWE